MGLAGFIKGATRSHLWFNNKKTAVTVEFGICPLMGISPTGTLTSPKCHGCYAARALNIYKTARAKLERVNPKTLTADDVADFIADLRDLLARDLLPFADDGKPRLRFFGLSDFVPEAMPFILAASKIINVDILSKTLAMRVNEKHLIALVGADNVWVSLSFNKDFRRDLPRIEALLIKEQAPNVQLNYTLDCDSRTKHFEDPTLPFFSRFSVLHPRNRVLGQRVACVDRWGIDERRVCGVFGQNGGRVSGGGSCQRCNNCHISYVDTIKGKLPTLPIGTIA